MFSMHFSQMMKRLMVSMSLIYSLSAGGCIYLVVGSVGALGGYIVSPDTVEGLVTDYEFEDVWRAAIDVVSIMGVIEDRGKEGGTITAKIQNTRVTIDIYHMATKAVKVSVKARKSFFPRIKVAQDVYVKIINSLQGEI